MTPAGDRLYSAIVALQASRHFPLALVPHLILFLSGEKQALRVVLDEDLARALETALRGLGYATVSGDVGIRSVADDWGQLEAHSQDEPRGESLQCLLVCATFRELATRTFQEELNGESIIVGRLLGYPECCVAAYPQLAAAASNWSAHLLSITNPPFHASLWCNRLASNWGGTCPTGELFPCSLTCAHAVRYGQRADELLRENGFAPLADEIRRQASQPLFWQDGKVLSRRPMSSTYRDIIIYA